MRGASCQARPPKTSRWNMPAPRRRLHHLFARANHALVAVPVLCSTKVDLYKMSTNLKWDYNSENIAGFVVKPESNELASAHALCPTLRFPERVLLTDCLCLQRPFDIAPGAKSRVELADELWATMA